MARPKNDENGKVSESGFRIRRRVLPSGAAVFLVDLGLVNGKRRRQQFATITAARNHCRLLAVDAERVGLAAFALSDHDREDAVQALRMLAGTGASLSVVAAAYCAKHGPPKASKTFQALCDDFLDWMQTTSRKLDAKTPGPYRPASIVGIAGQLRRTYCDLGDTPAIAITADELRRWLDAQGFSPVTWDNHRRAVGMVFSWATRKDGPLDRGTNPVSGMRPPPMARRNPAIYTPEVTERVLRYVESHRPDLAPSFAIAFFAGIRPEELRRITPDELDFDSGEIRIPAEVSKTHQERLVTMSDNLLAWLVRHPPEAGKPLGATAPAVMHFRKGMREALGVDTPKDIARHCFATYYCALHGMDATAEQLGHESTAMLHRHYKGLARNRASAAARYFAIGPKPAEEATLLHLVSATA